MDKLENQLVKTTLDLMQIARTGANLIIDANTKTTVDIIQIVGSIGLKEGHITIVNASTKTTADLIQIATVYAKNITFDFTDI